MPMMAIKKVIHLRIEYYKLEYIKIFSRILFGV